MFKYAFIMNSRSLTPETYSAAYQNEEFYCFVAAVHGMKMTRELAKKLVNEGIELIDLCGDYTKNRAEEIYEAVNEQADVCYAEYTAEEQRKFDALESTKEYGLIIMADGLEGKLVSLNIESEECNTHIILVDSDDMAAEAAKKLVANGVNFIELCSYFDLEKAKDIINVIDGKVPVGYCG